MTEVTFYVVGKPAAVFQTAPDQHGVSIDESESRSCFARLGLGFGFAATLVTLSKCLGLSKGRSDLCCGHPGTDPALDVQHDHVLVDIV